MSFMQIKHLACSNIYNFNFKTDLHIPHHGVNFDIAPDTSDIHIVIWSSWSWKSQFFRILQHLWSHIWYHHVVCDLQILDDRIDSESDSSIIQPVMMYDRSSFPFETFHQASLPGKLIIQIHLWSVDLVKLNRLNQHIDDLNILIKQYSDSDIVLHKCLMFGDREYTTLEYRIDYTFAQVSLIQTDDFSVFIHQYLQYYNLIKSCIIVHNRVCNTDQVWNHRDDLFDHVSGMRDLDIIALAWQDTVLTPHHNIIATLQVCKMVAGSHTHGGLYDQMYQDILYYLDTYLDLKLDLSYVNEVLTLWFTNRRKEKLRFEQLSSSDQACIVIIFHIVGSMTRFGMFIIEEPEVHLHPQYQLIIAQLLHDISKKYHLQVILNTNSSLMINENNIDNVFRLYVGNNGIHIVNPVIVEEGNEARLSQILNFTNSAKLFFVDTIILVEWETDEYFFRKYFRDMHISQGHRRLVNTFQIININGKGSLKMWTDFLSKFQINYRFIGDRDNIVEIGIDLNMGKYLHQARKNRRWYTSKSEQYEAVIYQIKTQSPKLWDKILTAIQKAKEKHILILSQWDFESYLGLQAKWLDVTITFMQEQYDKWKTEYRFASARKELASLYDLIFEK